MKLAVTGDGARRQGAGADDGARGCSACAELPEPPDAADALALALCHCGVPLAPRARTRRRVARAATSRPLRGGAGDRLGARHACSSARRRGEVLVEVGGVGYRVARAGRRACPRSTRATHAFLFTHLHVREDAMVLYGFPTRDERDTFEALIGAHGVGPKLALAILSVHSPAALRRGLADDDLDALMLVPGVGKRTAQRLLVELKARLEVPDLDLDRGDRRARPAPRGRGARRARRASATRPTRCATSLGAAARGRHGRGPAARRAQAAGGDAMT